MSDTTRRRRKLYLSPLVTLVLIGLALWQRQYIYDQIKLFNYEPSAEIMQLATDTAMTDGSRRVFYVNQPELIDKQRFSEFCTVHSEQTAVLGCYKGPQQGIYLLQVDRPELAGIEEVTAAHEMLHAEYDRLGSNERARINQLLQDFYKNKLKDEATKKTIDGYRKSAPEDLVNEMHSILGTQVSELTPELETYYARFFTDRSKSVKLYQNYEKAFSSRQAQVDAYDQQLTSLKRELDSLESSVTRQGEALRAQQARLQRLSTSNDVTSYNSLVDSYNAAAASYNGDIRRLEAIVANYNKLVEARNALSFEEQELVEAISAPSVEQQ